MTHNLYTARQASKAGLTTTEASSLAASIRWCATRHHVSASRMAVLRDACGRMRLAAKRRRKSLVLTREARKFVYRVALRAHAENVALYHSVVTGRI